MADLQERTSLCLADGAAIMYAVPTHAAVNVLVRGRRRIDGESEPNIFSNSNYAP
jgi:hypothetical protein